MLEDGSRRSEEIVKISNCALECDYYYYYYYYYFYYYYYWKNARGIHSPVIDEREECPSLFADTEQQSAFSVCFFGLTSGHTIFLNWFYL